MLYDVCFIHENKETQFVNMELIAVGVDKREALEKDSAMIAEGQQSCHVYRDEFGKIVRDYEMKPLEEGVIVLAPADSLRLLIKLEVAWNRRQKARLLRQLKKNNKKSD